MIKLFKQWLVITMLLTLVSGCVSLERGDSSLERANSPPTQYFTLQPVPDQLIGQIWLEKFSFNGVVKRSMLIQTELNPNDLSLVALTFEGIPLLQSRYLSNTGQIVSESTLKVGLDPAQIFHDLQSVYWPQAILQQHLMPNIRLVEQFEPLQHREFYYGEQLIRTIEYRDNQITVNDLAQGYQLDIIRLTTESQSGSQSKSNNDEK